MKKIGSVRVGAAVCCLFMTAIVTIYGICMLPVSVKAGEADGRYIEEIKEQIDLTEVDALMESDLFWPGESKITFTDLVTDLMEHGIDGMDTSIFKQWAFDTFFYEIEANRKLLIEVVLLAIGFSILKNFTGAFRADYISQLCFMLVYCVLGVMLLQSFLTYTEIVENALTGSVDFMKVVIPTLSITMVFSTGVGTSTGFYQIAFLVIYLIQWLFLKILLPGIRIYVILVLFNYFFEDKKFENLTELVKGGICWSMKIAAGIVLGLNVVEALIGPAKDRLIGGNVLRAASLIPGIGNTVNGVGEILVGSGILIKNCVGVAALIILLLVGLVPLIKIACLAFFYKLAAAVTEPVADKRIAGCLKGMSEGGMLYLKLTGYSLALFFLTVALTTASSGLAAS